MTSPNITTTITERVEELSGQTIPLSSSWLTSCQYDKDTQALDVTMQNGNTYNLTGVPPDTFLAFIDAPSPGTFWNNELKGKY
jgi:hypothetical protein